MYRRYGPKDYEKLIKELKEKETPKVAETISIEDFLRAKEILERNNVDPYPSRDKTESDGLCPVAPKQAKCPQNGGNASSTGSAVLHSSYDASRSHREAR